MEILGDFELDRAKLIGKGAWGEVYKGKQISLNRPVAIKILKPGLTQDKEFVQRFQREAECLAKLTDEHIIQVYGAGEYQDSYYFAMEYVPGMPLQKFIERGRLFSTDEVIYLGIAVAKALKTAWETPEQIIHRDIKPSNIMLAFSTAYLDRLQQPGTSERLDIRQAKVKVMDFGLAKAAKTAPSETEEEKKELTMTGVILGTPKYLSPEQGLGNPVDIRSDIYSLGIVLYEAASGRIPFEAETVTSLIRHHIYDTPTAPRQIRPEIPVELEAIILKCIRKDPPNRYHNPDELLEDLEAIKHKSSPLHARAGESDYEATVIARPARVSRKRIIPIGLALVIIIFLGAIFYDLISGKKLFWAVLRLVKPNVNPATIVEPSEKPSQDENAPVKITVHTKDNTNNPFDYGVRLTAFIKNDTAEEQRRKLIAELTWGGKTYRKEKMISLPAKSSDSFSIDFYEPTAKRGFYNYEMWLAPVRSNPARRDAPN